MDEPRAVDGAPTPPAAWPRISIMIPTYNQARFLEEAVTSSLAQDYPNLEVVVCDDASSDDTASVVARLARDPRVKSHRNSRNIGRVANYRRLLEELAGGAWVLMLDGDDRLTGTSYLRTAMSLALSDPGIVLVLAKAAKGADLGSDAIVLNASIGSAHGPVTAPSPVMAGNEFFMQFPPFETIVPLHATCLYHRDSAIEIGFYAQDILSSDIDSFYRLMLGRKVGFVDAVAALWRQHAGNATRTIAYRDLRENAAVFDGPAQRAIELACFAPGMAERWLRRCRARYIVSMAAQCWRRSVPVRDALRLGADLLRRDWRVVTELAPAAVRAWRNRGPARH
jgi:glycosyltransferase involved in cell wall biosynthesis